MDTPFYHDITVLMTVMMCDLQSQTILREGSRKMVGRESEHGVSEVWD